MDDLDQIKRDNPIRDYARWHLGKAEHHHSYDVYPCCFHTGDHSPSLTIYEDHFWCFGCRKHGTIFDLVMKFENLDFKQAVERLKRNVPPPKLLPERVESTPVSNLCMSAVEQNFAHIQEGLPYFERRGISDSTSFQKRLGVKVDYRSTYLCENGTQITFAAKRYAVPNLWEDKLYSINYRRDDQAFLEAFHAHPAHTLVLDDLKKKDIDISDKTILDKVAGAKYKQASGSHWHPFNKALILHKENGELVRHRLPYAVVHAETKEMDTLAAQDAGYPCIGINLTTEIRPVIYKLFISVDLVFILRDNDEAGMQRALALQDALGRGRIITPADECKDTGEMIQAAIFDRHMAKFGIEPILRQHQQSA